MCKIQIPEKGKLDFYQGNVRELSGKFALLKLWTPCRLHLEGSILLRRVNWQVTFFFVMLSMRHTLWSEHESAYCAIQTGIKQERIKSKDFRTCTKVKQVWVLAVYRVYATLQVTCTCSVGIKFFSNCQPTSLSSIKQM